MTTFTKHFDNDIHEWIETPGQRDLVARIRGLNANDLNEFHDDLQMEVSIDPNCVNTHTMQIAFKTCMRMVHEFKRKGIHPTKPVTVDDVIFGVMGGMMFADEFAKRFIK